LKEVKKKTWKKIDQPCIKPVSQQSKLESGPFSALFACANKATVRELRNYMNNKTSGKYHSSVTSSFSKTKISLVFRSTRDLQKIHMYPWKTEFLAYTTSQKRSTNQQKQLRNDAFHVKTSQSAKISSIPQKTKIGPKCYIRPFCTKTFNYLKKMCGYPNFSLWIPLALAMIYFFRVVLTWHKNLYM